jgi:hypothetical protein
MAKSRRLKRYDLRPGRTHPSIAAGVLTYLERDRTDPQAFRPFESTLQGELHVFVRHENEEILHVDRSAQDPGRK